MDPHAALTGLACPVTPLARPWPARAASSRLPTRPAVAPRGRPPPHRDSARGSSSPACRVPGRACARPLMRRDPSWSRLTPPRALEPGHWSRCPPPGTAPRSRASPAFPPVVWPWRHRATSCAPKPPPPPPAHGTGPASPRRWWPCPARPPTSVSRRAGDLTCWSPPTRRAPCLAGGPAPSARGICSSCPSSTFGLASDQGGYGMVFQG